MIQKRGMSTVIASVLLILLTISAVAIIANFIIPFTEDSLESTECFEFREHFLFDEDFDYNCYDTANGKYILSVKVRPENSSSEKVAGISFRLTSKTSGTSATAFEGDVAAGEGDSTKVIGILDRQIGIGTIVIPKPTGRYSAITYNYTSTEAYEKAEVYPVLEDGRICEASDAIQITEC
ncbi:MAG: hypothetical protein Q7S27_02105 [Nanoarchaeota archaeon]|nr:hypothetical protein [Nanoarchaeota archaeon]